MSGVLGLVDPRVATQEMLAAAWEPMVAYPGWANSAWASRCMRCGAESRPRLNGVRRGGRCGSCRAKAAEQRGQQPRRSRPWSTCGAGFEPLAGRVEAGDGMVLTCGDVRCKPLVNRC